MLRLRQVTHNFVGCLRREVTLRQLQQERERPREPSGVSAAAAQECCIAMSKEAQQKMDMLESEREARRHSV